MQHIDTLVTFVPVVGENETHRQLRKLGERDDDLKTRARMGYALTHTASPPTTRPTPTWRGSEGRVAPPIAAAARPSTGTTPDQESHPSPYERPTMTTTNTNPTAAATHAADDAARFTLHDDAAVLPLLDTVREFFTEYPDLAVRFRDGVTNLVRNTEYPSLIVEAVTDDGETYEGMRCPWCGTDVANAEELAAVDENDRHTRFSVDEFDWERRTITTVYDDSGEFDGITYLHLDCYRPVSLPDDWREI